MFAGPLGHQSKLSCQSKASFVVNPDECVHIVDISGLSFLEDLGQQSLANTLPETMFCFVYGMLQQLQPPVSVECSNKSDVEPIVVSKLTAYSSSLQSLRVSFVLVIDLSYQHVTVVSNESKSSFFLRKHLIKLFRSLSNRKDWEKLLVDISKINH